jgi:hypothetical protein
MYDFNDELMAHEASSASFKYAAEKIGIVLMDSQANDEVAAIWIFQRQQPDGSFKMQQITCKSHSASSAIIGVLKSIGDISKYKNSLTIKLVGYERAKKIVKRKLSGE